RQMFGDSPRLALSCCVDDTNGFHHSPSEAFCLPSTTTRHHKRLQPLRNARTSASCRSGRKGCFGARIRSQSGTLKKYLNTELDLAGWARIEEPSKVWRECNTSRRSDEIQEVEYIENLGAKLQ